MANLGPSLLDCVNDMLRAIGEGPVSSVPTTNDGSDAWDAWAILLRLVHKLQIVGYPEYTDFGKQYQPDGAGGAASATSVSVAFTDGTYTASTRTLTKTAAFADYAHNAADEIYIYSDTGDSLIKEGYYVVAGRTNANSITLNHAPAVSDNTRIAARKVGDLKVTLSSDILRVRSAGRDSYRNLQLGSADVLVDQGRLTERMENDDLVTLDVTRSHGLTQTLFAEISPTLKERLTAYGRLEFQRWKNDDPQREAMLFQEIQLLEAQMQRNPIQTHNEVQPFGAINPILGAIPNQGGDQRR
tara:strand:+ start:4833 stop:5732 length:900 start_codon:yes stop_codon:yes gene_type:complete